MEITRLSLWHIPLTSHLKYQMSEGKACDTVTTVVLRIDTDSDVHGWGEYCAIPHYLPAYANGVAPAVKELAPLLISQNPLGVQAIMYRLNKYLIGHGYAKSAIDMALWDINAKAAGQPLYNLLGGLFSANLPTYHSITCTDPELMRTIALDAHASGIRQFQCKLGADNDWQSDVERLRVVRAAVGDGPLVYGDWNCGASKLDAIRVGRAVNDLDIMLEQPCATLEQCASVKHATGLAMKIDENAQSVADLQRASELDCIDAVALKISKFGGLSAALQARDRCVQLGIKMCVEDTWGSDIVTAAALHLAAATPTELVMNVCDLSSYVHPRLDPQAPVRTNGSITAPSGPGLGVTPDMTLLGEPDLVLS